MEDGSLMVLDGFVSKDIPPGSPFTINSGNLTNAMYPFFDNCQSCIRGVLLSLVIMDDN